MYERKLLFSFGKCGLTFQPTTQPLSRTQNPRDVSPTRTGFTQEFITLKACLHDAFLLHVIFLLRRKKPCNKRPIPPLLVLYCTLHLQNHSLIEAVP